MSKVAIRYAKAILDISLDSDNAEKVNENMQLIASTVVQNRDLQVFLSNPVVKPEVKNEALNEIFTGSEKETEALFHLLAFNKRFELLMDTALEYQKQFDVFNGIETVTVTTAYEMDAATEQDVVSKAKQFTDKKIKLVKVIDKDILGGFIIRIGDNQINASAKHRLREIKKELSN
jgi:F-type H+-transporting ATPase subunit delta